jgi:hypothetical protein
MSVAGVVDTAVAVATAADAGHPRYSRTGFCRQHSVVGSFHLSAKWGSQTKLGGTMSSAPSVLRGLIEGHPPYKACSSTLLIPFRTDHKPTGKLGGWKPSRIPDERSKVQRQTSCQTPNENPAVAASRTRLHLHSRHRAPDLNHLRVLRTLHPMRLLNRTPSQPRYRRLHRLFFLCPRKPNVRALK